MKKHIVLFFCIATVFAYAQKKQDPVYVDKEGVMRWTSDNKEASFFGVNYTVPFAYGFRSHKALGVDLEKAIDADVNHMARLGLDAFRVHVWDVDITDSLGNLLDNEHLRLFDYLLARLKEKNIRILITPIAFWGNGYPERDVRTNGFSYVYGKGPSVVKEEAFKAQENYLKQFFNHVNPYTKLKYKDDPDVIAMEINNEPHHSGAKQRTTEYVNRMAAAVKSTGWTKPVFYNISESYRYADAIVKAKVDGHSFQWYPTGLVANRERKGNYLPHVERYHIPFGDTIPAFKKRALMVYEFDAGDVMQPVMYPAMARSYRSAGFQWATQFAYDPLYTAYGNTEYQTHYLNLVYTPQKAISLLIASEIFHRIPLRKSYGGYPSDTLFDVFRLSYHEQLTEMNSGDKFYYTGSTSTIPKNIDVLQHLAGTGSSSLVQYDGTGAYFLDKRTDGQWKLEVYPDAITISDPFERASPKKEVVEIIHRKNKMKINLPGLGSDYLVRPVNEGNNFSTTAIDGTISIVPGVYLLTAENTGGRINVPEEWKRFYAPATSIKEPILVHHPFDEITADKKIKLKAIVAGIDSSATVAIELRNSSQLQWKTLQLKNKQGYEYEMEIPSDFLTPGLISYRIMIRTEEEIYTFPGAFKGNPYAWDEWRNESWTSFVASEKSSMEIFHSTRDRNLPVMYNTDWRNNRVEYIAADDPGRLALKTTMNQPAEGQMMGWQFYFGDRIKGRQTEMSSFTKVQVKARASSNVKVNFALIDTDANCYGSEISLSNEWKTIEIPLGRLQKDSMLLLPRPFPGFQRLWFQSTSDKQLKAEDLEKLELRFTATSVDPATVEVQWIRLKK